MTEPSANRAPRRSRPNSQAKVRRGACTPVPSPLTVAVPAPVGSPVLGGIGVEAGVGDLLDVPPDVGL